MEAKTIRPQAKAIQGRFFQAVDLLIQSGKIRGLQSFCKAYGLHRPKYSNLRTSVTSNDHNLAGYKVIDIDALAYLSADFGISADWLLLGTGSMFK